MEERDIKFMLYVSHLSLFMSKNNAPKLPKIEMERLNTDAKISKMGRLKIDGGSI